MIYRVVDKRALGRASVFGTPPAPPRSAQAGKAPVKKALGQEAENSLSVAWAQYQTAKEIYERTQASGPDLATVLGQAKADQAVGEALASMNAAAQAYNDSIEVVR